MTEPKTILIVSVLLVVLGIGTSFYQSQKEIDNLSSQQQSLDKNSSMKVIKNLDPEKSKSGVYSAQISDFKDGDLLKIDVVDPVGNVISTSTISKNQFQENFTVVQLGNYTLQIQNAGQNETQVLGIIGYYPQGATILDVISIIVLIIGLIGLGIGMMNLIRKRGKANVS